MSKKNITPKPDPVLEEMLKDVACSMDELVSRERNASSSAQQAHRAAENERWLAQAALQEAEREQQRLAEENKRHKYQLQLNAIAADMRRKAEQELRDKERMAQEELEDQKRKRQAEYQVAYQEFEQRMASHNPLFDRQDQPNHGIANWSSGAGYAQMAIAIAVTIIICAFGCPAAMMMLGK